MSRSVLHSQTSEVNPNPEKRDCSFTSGPTLDRQTPNEDKAATIEHLIEQGVKPRTEGGKREVVSTQRGQIRSRVCSFRQLPGCAFNFADFRFGKMFYPIRATHQVLTKPGRAIANLRRQCVKHLR